MLLWKANRRLLLRPHLNRTKEHAHTGSHRCPHMPYSLGSGRTDTQGPQHYNTSASTVGFRWRVPMHTPWPHSTVCTCPLLLSNMRWAACQCLPETCRCCVACFGKKTASTLPPRIRCITAGKPTDEPQANHVCTHKLTGPSYGKQGS